MSVQPALNKAEIKVLDFGSQNGLCDYTALCVCSDALSAIGGRAWCCPLGR
jgi:hypothetical protein